MNSTSWNDLAEVKTAQAVSAQNNVLIVDANNVAYRFLQRSNYNSYGAELERTIESLGKSYGATRHIVCFDFGKSYFRKDMYEEYKSTRKAPKDDEEAKKYEEFFDVLNKAPDFLPFECHKYRGVEADDLIAFFVLNLKEQYDNIWIISSDRDLWQLLDDNVHIFNMYSRKEITIDTLLETTGLEPKEYMFSRIIEGDTGDAIYGVEGIGPKRAQGIVRKYPSLDLLLHDMPISGTAKYIKNLNASVELLIRNERLINLHAYHEAAIKAGQDGEENWKHLQECL